MGEEGLVQGQEVEWFRRPAPSPQMTTVLQAGAATLSFAVSVKVLPCDTGPFVHCRGLGVHGSAPAKDRLPG